jgi:hypothetical protein
MDECGCKFGGGVGVGDVQLLTCLSSSFQNLFLSSRLSRRVFVINEFLVLPLLVVSWFLLPTQIAAIKSHLCKSVLLPKPFNTLYAEENLI